MHIILGTGKSTFLVNVICRRLATDSKARILVTAPTNRAVTGETTDTFEMYDHPFLSEANISFYSQSLLNVFLTLSTVAMIVSCMIAMRC